MMLHSGSRNIGKELAEHHIWTARTLAHNAELPDRDLAVFLAGTSEMAAYRHDLYWAQEYAFLNRRTMLHVYKSILEEFWPGVKYESEVLCHHNYVSEEFHYENKCS
jgi:tRNA-splicing ligase RtcB